MNNSIPAGSSPALTRAPGQPLSGTYIGCSVMQNVPARPPFSVYRCNRRRCATCALIQPSRFFRSSLTNRRYTVISACDLSCFSTNVIWQAALNAISSTLGEQKERSLSDYLVIAPLSRNTQTLSSLGISVNLPWHTMNDIRIQPIEHITQSPRETERYVAITRLDRERPFGCRTWYYICPYQLWTQWSLATRWKRFTFFYSIQKQCVYIGPTSQFVLQRRSGSWWPASSSNYSSQCQVT